MYICVLESGNGSSRWVEGVTGLLVNVENISINIVWHYGGEPGFSMGFIEPTHNLKFM